MPRETTKAAVEQTPQTKAEQDETEKGKREIKHLRECGDRQTDKDQCGKDKNRRGERRKPAHETIPGNAEGLGAGNRSVNRDQRRLR
jgi:hypothetical protein